MTKFKSTKRALLASGLALLVCISMLIGSTFAWFTDNVTSTGNKIVAGTLDIDLFKIDIKSDWFNHVDDPDFNPFEEVEITESSAPIFAENILWEPGYTEVANLKLVNNGNLALKYQAVIRPTGEIGKLAEVIDVYVCYETIDTRGSRESYEDKLVKVGTLKEVMSGTSIIEGEMKTAGETQFFTIVLKMQENANNDYQGKTAGAFDITVLATQLTYEKDSFDNQYDKDADYDGEISNATTLAAAFTNGGTYKVLNDIDAGDETFVAADGTALNLDGNELSANSFTSLGNTYIANGTLVMSAEGSVYASETNANITLEDVVIDSDSLSVLAEAGGTITLKDVTIKNTTTSNPVQNYGGTLIIDNAVVAQEGDAASAWYSSAIQVINQIVRDSETGKWKTVSQANTTIENGNYTGEKAIMISAPGGNVTINGGTFVGSEAVIQADFAPQNYLDGSNFESVVTINGGSFTGKIKASKAAEVYINGGNFNVTFDVKPETKLVIKGGTFSADPSAYVADGYVAVENADGTYSVVKGAAASTQDDLDDAIADGTSTVVLGSGEYTIPDTAIGKTMTIIGNGDTTVAVQDDGGSEGDIDYSFRGSNVTFENVTLNIKGSDHPGYAGLSATYNNCTIVGSNYTLYGDSVFNNCTFNLNNGYVWTWGAANVEFNGCTFNDTVGGKAKAILVHNTVATKVTVKDCTFVATTSAQTWDSIPVAAVSIDPENGSPAVTVYFEGTNTYSDAFNGLYQLKYAPEKDVVTVYVNGEKVDVPCMKETHP